MEKKVYTLFYVTKNNKNFWYAKWIWIYSFKSIKIKRYKKKTNRDKKEIILKIKKLKDSILKGRELKKLYIEWDQSLINYVYSLKDIPYSTKYDILKNLMHIQINRFYGVDRNLEEEILEVIFILLKFVINNKCDEKSDKDEHII